LNKPAIDGRFYQWLDEIATKINLKGWTLYRGDFGDTYQDAYYTVWHGIEIIFHIAPWMDAEGHRRLIGNDICFIIFYDNEDTSFDTISMDSLGTVPQLFAVVQPSGPCMFRFGFFQRSNLKLFDPPSPPSDHIFDIGGLKEYLFTKLHNGLVMAKRCPPMNRFFTAPRGAALTELAKKYAKEMQVRGKRQRRKKSQDDLCTFKVTLITARNLSSRGDQSSYCLVELGDVVRKTQLRTTTVQQWNAVFEFDISNLYQETEKLKITLFNGGHGTEGELLIPLKDVFDADDTPKWFTLNSSTITISGELLLSFSSVDTSK